MDVAGAVGWAVAGAGWEAALALVPQEAQATGTTLERALRTGKRHVGEEGQPGGHPGPRAVAPKGCAMGAPGLMPTRAVMAPGLSWQPRGCLLAAASRW